MISFYIRCCLAMRSIVPKFLSVSSSACPRTISMVFESNNHDFSAPAMTFDRLRSFDIWMHLHLFENKWQLSAHRFGHVLCSAYNTRPPHYCQPKSHKLLWHCRRTQVITVWDHAIHPLCVRSKHITSTAFDNCVSELPSTQVIINLGITNNEFVYTCTDLNDVLTTNYMV